MKGVSSLTSATLLVAFVISLSALFLPWAQNLVGGSQRRIEGESDEIKDLSSAGVEVRDLEYGSKGNVSFGIQNTGSVNLKDVNMTLYCSDGIRTFQVASSLKESEAISRTFNSDCSEIKKAVFTAGNVGYSKEVGQLTSVDYTINGTSSGNDGGGGDGGTITYVDCVDMDRPSNMTMTYNGTEIEGQSPTSVSSCDVNSPTGLSILSP